MKAKFYVYAGYYEIYISSKPLNKPHVFLKKFKRNIRGALKFAESFDDTIRYCRNIRKYLRDKNLVEWLDEHQEWYDEKTGQLC